ncbi:hypothetical protein HPP92_010300 [Vanilla planifolia]|uniref:Hexosyltransferase n=1 Tax=Vanilla planifolia TaxID=51239 RepID=A0A835V3Y2_VANPL|nr:hypothetical protein HPP92_010300 [Vanilla planifolia]
MASMALFLLILLRCVSPVALRSFPFFPPSAARYSKASQFLNHEECPADDGFCGSSSFVHVAMTLDAHYLRGSIAAIHSILRHTACPDSIFFHFVAATGDEEIPITIRTVFPSIRFLSYRFSDSRIRGLISSSVRSALENPLNYARNYIADLLDPCIRRVIYLDSDVIVVDDIRQLWNSAAAAFSDNPSAAIAAPEYCNANFTRYFTSAFWNGPWKHTFNDRRRKSCYFNTGVMAMDLARWRENEYGLQIERWMEIQKQERIYDLGSLPPFLLVFAGEIEGLDHRWNQHGLGGDMVRGSCRDLHPGPASLLHWSGKGKPWERLDVGEACYIDYLWKMYDLYSPSLFPSFSSIFRGKLWEIALIQTFDW